MWFSDSYLVKFKSTFGAGVLINHFSAVGTFNNCTYANKIKHLRYNVISHTFSSLRNNYNLTFAFFATSKSDNVIVKKSSYDISDNIGAMRFALAFMTFSKKIRTSLPFA